MSWLNRPPRRPLSATQRKLVGGTVGIGAIVLGILFVLGPKIGYPAGDYRGSTAFAVLSGGLAIAIGIFVLVWTFSGRSTRGGR